jgi:hypothetical protein
MTSKVIGSIVALVLACSAATAADIRRVVTALDANDKAIALFDSRVTLEPGSTPSVKLWVTDTAPAGLSFTDDSGAKPTALPPDLGTALLVVEFPPLDPAEEAKMDPNFMMTLLTLTSRSSVRLKRRRRRTTEAPLRPSGRRGRISERPQRPESMTVPLQSRPNATPFWIMLLLSVGVLEHGMIKQIAPPLWGTREPGGRRFESVRARQPSC